FMIGFIHLTMLGFISGLLFALFWKAGAWTKNGLIVAGTVSFIVGFVLTEMMLFVQGLFYWLNWGLVPFHYETLFGASALLPLGIFIILISQMSNFGYKNANVSQL